jgi:hypothetical protein
MVINSRSEDRLMAIPSHPALVAGMFTPSRTWVRCESGLPEGATFVGLDWYDAEGGIRYPVFVFRHASFPLVPAGDPLPTMAITFEQLWRPSGYWSGGGQD